MLYKLVGQTLLYGVETVSLTSTYCDRLDGCYSRFVGSMLAIRKTAHETLEEFICRRNDAAARVIALHDARISRMALRKQWRYLGHVLRSDFTVLKELLLFRTNEWWTAERDKTRPKRHRRGGAQLMHVLASIEDFLRHRGIDLTIAQDRDAWKSLEEDFCSE
eukprot:7810641-Karenia_brevis.AAC.1